MLDLVGTPNCLFFSHAKAHMFQARVWKMCLGFTSLFGALFSKTWRVHKLFRDNSLKKTVS